MMTTDLAPVIADALGQQLTVSTEMVDGCPLIVLERGGDIVADLEPAQALALAHTLLEAC
ncbi:hypothetical protein [Gordonia sp. KTR9]|uniref:hypothetical protein n=1 Tax=Gordonia sp. KTR9 TaxID=337191 RepID=UPI00030EED4D|nr:hypothetical protein [Gordonia sp. KTR9]